MSHKLFDDKVKLEPVSHRYYDASGKEYMSVSKFIKFLSQPFEHTYAYRMASPETLAEWEKKRDDAANGGTRVHNALENYSKHGIISDEDKEFEEAIKSVISEYKSYYKCHEEICLYDKEYRLAGTTDKICVISRKSDSDVDLADYKTNTAHGIEFFSRYNKWMYEPISHLQDCNYNKYSIQMSLYAYFFEKLTGRRVRRMFLHHVPLNDLSNHKIIPVTYLRNDVQLILDKYRDGVLDILSIKEQEELEF